MMRDPDWQLIGLCAAAVAVVYAIESLLVWMRTPKPVPRIDYWIIGKHIDEDYRRFYVSPTCDCRTGERLMEGPMDRDATPDRLAWWTQLHGRRS
jgi:hypothetical protein